MNRTQLVKNLARRTGQSRRETKIFLEQFQNEIIDQLNKDEKITMIGFGTFKTTERKQKIGRNPKTNEQIIFPAHKAPVFKFSGLIKKSIKEEE